MPGCAANRSFVAFPFNQVDMNVQSNKHVTDCGTSGQGSPLFMTTITIHPHGQWRTLLIITTGC